MRKIINVEKRYINVPVKKNNSTTHVTLRAPADGELLKYFDIAPGKDDDYDFIAYHDMEELVGSKVEVEIEDEIQAGHFFNSLRQSDSPLGLDGVYHEAHRPQFHFSAKRGWLNDPNGLFFYNGTYHLFFQHNPFGTSWGNMHWGHAVSSDLIHWKELGDVLCPDKMGMMFSGGAVVDWDNTSGLQQGEHPPVFLFYTATGIFEAEPGRHTQCAAYSLDGGKTFTKYANNPVVGYTAKDARDPSVIRHHESGRWIMTLYLGDTNRTFRIFKSGDLLNWESAEQDEFEILGGRECPEFFPVAVDGDEANRKWIMMEANGKYMIGDFDGERFTAEAGPFAAFTRYGNGCCYACQSWSDMLDGRRVLVGWLRGDCESPVFNQCMTIPVECTMKTFADGPRLCFEPVRELEALRGELWEFADLVPPCTGVHPELAVVPPGNTWDIELEIAEDSELFIAVCGENIALDSVLREVRMDAVRLPFPAESGELKVRILVDQASIEIFGGDGRMWYSKRVLTQVEHPVMFPHCASGTGMIKSLKIYKMNSIWD